jgi:uncharacterized delta-60 repeat protein
MPNNTQITPCCYNTSNPITAKISLSDSNLNNSLTQVVTYNSESDGFDTWVQLKATLPPSTTTNIFDVVLQIDTGLNCCCEYDVFVDRIGVLCTGTSESLLVNDIKCPGFDLTKVIDNKKSWVYNPGLPEVGISEYDVIERADGSFGLIAGEGTINRTFAPSPDAEIPWRYTNYWEQSSVYEKHSNLVLNSKELWLTFDMCADCPISGTTLACPSGYTLSAGTDYCYSVSGYTSTPDTGVTTCYTLSSTTGVYSACTNYSLNIGKYYSADVIISAYTLNQSFLNPTFGDSTKGLNTNSAVFSVANQSNGKILIGGSSITGYSNTNTQNLLRVNSNGILDTTFVYSGINYFYCYDIVLQPDGKIITAWVNSTVATSKLLQRVTSGGTVDPTFNLLDFNGNGIYNIKLNSDGSMYVAGNFSTVSGLNYSSLVKITSGGTIDSSFNTLNNFGGGSYANTVDTLSDGTVVVGGNFTTYSSTTVGGLIFLNPNGTLNSSYPTANLGPLVHPYSAGTSSTEIYSLTIDDNDIYAVGRYVYSYSGDELAVFKIKSGTTTFDINFANNTGVPNSSGFKKIKVDNNGDLIIGGDFDSYSYPAPSYSNTITSRRILKLDNNGNILKSFGGTNGGFSGITSFYPIVVNDISINNDNNLIIGGDFDYFNGCGTRNISIINNSTTTVSDCYNIINSGGCQNCCSYSAENFIGPYYDSSCTVPALSAFTTTSATTEINVTYLSLLNLEKYKKQVQSFWVPFMEQFTPATAIWVSGERWCNEPCSIINTCDFDLTESEVSVINVEEGGNKSLEANRSPISSNVPEVIVSVATLGNSTGFTGELPKTETKDIIPTKDLGFIIEKTNSLKPSDNDIDILSYRNKFTSVTLTVIENI